MKKTRGSSRGEQEPPAGSSSRGGSRGPTSAYSVSALRLSSRTERTIGGLFVPPVPVLATGPFSVATLDGARLTWTLDEAGAAGFHRVRTKKGAGGSWMISNWGAGEADYSGLIDVTGQDPEGTLYYYDVQSAGDKDDEATFMDWAPGDNTAYYTTLCSGIYGIDNVVITKEGYGKLEYLHVSWTTTVSMNNMQTAGNVSNLDYGPGSASGTTHYHDYMDFEFREGSYWIKIKMRNKCYVWSAYSGPYNFTVSAGGEVDQI